MKTKIEEQIETILGPGPVMHIAPPTQRYQVEQAMRRAYRNMDKKVLDQMIPTNRAEARRHLRGNGPYMLRRRQRPT